MNQNQAHKNHDLRIRRCIKQLSVAIDQNNVFLVPRKKNLNTLSILGLNKKSVWNLLKRLKRQHYIGGPEPDDQGRNGEIWKFKFPFNDIWLYIKLSFPEEGKGRVKCISFHENWD